MARYTRDENIPVENVEAAAGTAAVVMVRVASRDGGGRTGKRSGEAREEEAAAALVGREDTGTEGCPTT